jgi:hypothetical protein
MLCIIVQKLKTYRLPSSVQRTERVATDSLVYRAIRPYAQPVLVLQSLQYVVVSKIFLTDAVKIIKLTITPICRHHLRSSFLPHINTGPTATSIFGTLPGSPFLSHCHALSAIGPGSPQWYQTGVLSASIYFLEIGRSHRVPNQGLWWSEDDSHFVCLY